MKTFQIHLDTKHTIWYRTLAQIEANSLEEAKEKAKQLYLDGQLEEVPDAYTETLYDTDEFIGPEDNAGEPTAELFVNDDLILTNLSPEDTSDFDDPGFDHRIDEEQNFIKEERENDRT